VAVRLPAPRPPAMPRRAEATLMCTGGWRRQYLTSEARSRRVRCSRLYSKVQPRAVATWA
jgi:hypothetical protein